MDRLVHDRILRHVHKGAVDEEGRVQRDERVVLESGEPSEIFLEGPRFLPKHLREGCNPNPFRKRPKVRQARRIPTVHEHQAARLQDTEGERFEFLCHDPIGPAGDGRFEGDAKEGREVREPPFLVSLRGETDGLEPFDRGPADSTKP